jgi:hypothetical protein
MVILDEGEVLQETAERDRGGTDGNPKSLRVESPRLPRKCRSLSLERTDERGGFVAVNWRFGPRLESGVHDRFTP